MATNSLRFDDVAIGVTGDTLQISSAKVGATFWAYDDASKTFHDAGSSVPVEAYVANPRPLIAVAPGGKLIDKLPVPQEDGTLAIFPATHPMLPPAYAEAFSAQLALLAEQVDLYGEVFAEPASLAQGH